MPKISIYNEAGQSVGELQLSEQMFGLRPNQALIHEVMVAQQANARHPIAHTKTRGDVRGGGKKPWKQKGTGRARQGSTRSPQWVGGGVVFGPSNERNYSLKVNKKAKRQALWMALSDKVAHGSMSVLEALTVSTPKTKHAAAVFAKLPSAKKTLFVVNGSQPVMMRMVRNLPRITMTSAQSLNLVDVLNHSNVVFLKDAVAAFEGIYRA